MQQLQPSSQNTMFKVESNQNNHTNNHRNTMEKPHTTKHHNNTSISHEILSERRLVFSDTGAGETSEWILFDNYSPHETLRGSVATDEVEKDSILSTRSSDHHVLEHHGEGYVISDFDVISDDEYNYQDDFDHRHDVDDDDDDSLINVVRDEMNSLIGINSKKETENQRNELISKINNWFMSSGGNRTERSSLLVKLQNSHEIQKEQLSNDNLRLAQTMVEIYYLNKIGTTRKLGVSHVKEFKRVLDKLKIALKKTEDVEHEGTFMNNPDLESCIPGNWKRMMLDNLISTNYDKNNIIYSLGSVAIDDINIMKRNNRNFWQRDESLSTQSVSTGWDGVEH